MFDPWTWLQVGDLGSPMHVCCTNKNTGEEHPKPRMRMQNKLRILGENILLSQKVYAEQIKNTGGRTSYNPRMCILNIDFIWGENIL